MLDSRDYAGIYSTQGLAQPKVSAKDDTFDLVGGASYFWIDLNDIDPESLIQLMQSAMNRRVSVVFGELVAKSKSMQWPAELATAARYTTLNMEVRVVRDPTEAEVILEQIYEAGKQLQLPSEMPFSNESKCWLSLVGKMMPACSCRKRSVKFLKIHTCYSICR